MKLSATWLAMAADSCGDSASKLNLISCPSSGASTLRPAATLEVAALSRDAASPPSPTNDLLLARLRSWAARSAMLRLDNRPTWVATRSQELVPWEERSRDCSSIISTDGALTSSVTHER